MSMLAERKQKQKWTLNPRGKYWSDDANKFGQKMLERMGWTAGKGLGAREDGITEHIKQSYKNDSKGIGFEDKGDQWTKHEVDFSSLLQNLSDSSDAGMRKPEVSLEKKSQTSRVRVHYHKFTRGKDLSRCSEKDLANVFGRRTLERKAAEVVVEASMDVSSESKDFGVVTVHGGNMADYFKNKFRGTVNKSDCESENERPSFGFGYKNETSDIKVECESDKISAENNDSVPKKKRKRTKVVINECFDNPGFQDYVDNPQNICDKGEGKKHSKEDMAFDNHALSLNLAEENQNQPEEESGKQKRSKKRKLETIIEEEPQAADSGETVPEKKKRGPKLPEPPRNEPAKKKRKKSKGICNPACTDLSTEQIGEGESAERVQCKDKVKKSKIREEQERGIDNLACTANSTEQKMEETIASMTSAIDNYQLELENQMNETKYRRQTQRATWRVSREHITNPKKSVKHLIQGKIRCNFQGSNLSKIAGYGVPR